MRRGCFGVLNSGESGVVTRGFCLLIGRIYPTLIKGEKDFWVLFLPFREVQKRPKKCFCLVDRAISGEKSVHL